MKAIVLLVALLTISSINAQSIETINLATLNNILESESTQIKVVNFWASWCAPCVKELPYFEELSKDENVDVHLVSLDFVQDVEKANKLILKKGITAPTYLLDEKNYVDKIDERWTGAIPATIIVDTNGRRYFYEKAFTQSELQDLVKNINTK